MTFSLNLDFLVLVSLPSALSRGLNNEAGFLHSYANHLRSDLSNVDFTITDDV